ncbi:MAG: hypothetical protein LBB44_05580 [Endomicrobium sp.]|jgi:hypothetical protein|nr:hypothetical protein [Endomicrobium sp.]
MRVFVKGYIGYNAYFSPNIKQIDDYTQFKKSKGTYIMLLDWSLTLPIVYITRLLKQSQKMKKELLLRKNLISATTVLV